MSQEVKDNLLSEITNVFSYYDNRISNLEKEIENHRNEIKGLQAKCEDLNTKNSDLKEELASFSKVSIIKSLNKSLLEKDGQIKFLESQLRNSKNTVEEKPMKVKLIDDEPQEQEEEEEPEEEEPQEEPQEQEPHEQEEEPEEEQEEEEEPEEKEEPEEPQEEEDDEEVEVEFIVKKLRGKEYYVTDDEDRDIYEKLEDDEVGDLVGKYNEKGRPTFFKKK